MSIKNVKICFFISMLLLLGTFFLGTPIHCGGIDKTIIDGKEFTVWGECAFFQIITNVVFIFLRYVSIFFVTIELFIIGIFKRESYKFFVIVNFVIALLILFVKFVVPLLIRVDIDPGL
jgi:hypothetical protein